MKINYNYYQTGQSLIETIVALGVIVIVISAMVSLGVVSLRATSSAKLAAIAKNLSDEELELIRVYRDGSTWSAFVTSMGGCTDPDCCYVSTGSPVSVVSDVGCSSGEISTSSGTDFTRKFVITDRTSSDGVIYVVTTTSWEDFGGAHTAVAETFFASWGE